MTDTFEFDGRTLPLLDHPYNATATNERAVEVPIALDWIARYKGEGRGIEIGNVLSHYSPIEHRVVDLYEQAPGIDNLDVFAIMDTDHDWLVAISTLEHVRWDNETPRNAFAAPAALAYVQGLARHVFVTIPFGQHPLFDEGLADLEVGRATTMVRGPDGWYQTAEPEFHERNEHGTASVWIGEWHA